MKKSYDQHRQQRLLKSKGFTLLTNVHLVKAMVFPVVMYRCELDHKDGWMLKKWCFQIVVLEKTRKNALANKEIKAVNPKGNQPWIFFGRTDAEAETPILWQPDVKIWLIGKDPDAGKIEGKRRRERQRMRWLDSITDSMDMNLSKLLDILKDRKAWRAAVHGVAKNWTQLSN